MAETIRDSGSGGRYSSFSPPVFSSGLFARYQPSQDDYVQEFYRLLHKWRYETLTISSTEDILSRLEFQEIVALGPKAVPLIVGEIRVTPDHLLAALALITGENPVPQRARGDFLEMANSWIAWYERRQ